MVMGAHMKVHAFVEHGAQITVKICKVLACRLARLMHERDNLSCCSALVCSLISCSQEGQIGGV
jgi:hypothetical protein